MTAEEIYSHFKEDKDLLKYYDPTSRVSSIKEACTDIYNKLIDHAKDKKCVFVNTEVGYMFYSKKLLISFCVNPKFRTKENLHNFSEFIKENIGGHFNCYLFNINSRGINFLLKMGMKIKKKNDLITLLSI